MKKLIIGAVVFAGWLAASIAFAVVGTSSSATEGSQFVVLTVKEDAVKDYNTMPVFQDLAKDTGIDVKWIYNTSTQYSNNTDPVGIKNIDAIYHSGFTNLQLYQYGSRNRIAKIDEYLTVMPNFSAILNKRPDIKEALKSPDGHIYSLPRVEEMGLKQYPNILYLNKAWVNKLIDNGQLPDGVSLTAEDLKNGLDLTRNQFKAILGKFQALDMDGDGDSTDEIPLTFLSGNWQGNESDLIASFGVPENREHKTIVNKKVTFTFEDENWLKAVQELHEWYDQSLFRPTVMEQTDNDFLAKGQDGHYGSFYWWEKDTVLKKDIRDDYIIVKPLIDDETGLRHVGISNELEVEKGAAVILETCEDKEGLLSYFDHFFEPKISAQLNYGSIKSGAFLPELVGGKLIPNPDHGEQSADDFRMKNAPYGVVYLTAEEWEKSVEMEPRAKLRLENLEHYVKPYSYAESENPAERAEAIPNLNYTKEQLTTLNIYERSLSDAVALWYATAVRKGGATVKSWQKMLKDNATAIETVKSINQSAFDAYEQAISGGKTNA